MNDIAIRRHSFDLAQKRLMEFSQRTEADIEIDKVRTDGGFLDLFDHHVTGDEFNRRIKTIQNHFITVNQTNNRLIKEFREVYNALDALDKDYIASIVANVKAIEKTSNDIRVQQGVLAQHHQKLADQQEKLDSHQTEIEKSVENISKIVGVLNVFKEKLNSYEHLKDVDKIWSDCQKWHEEIPSLLSSLSDTVSAVEANTRDIADVRQSLGFTNNSVAQISNSLSEQIKRIEALLAFVEGLEAITHLKDIDGMWDSLSNAHSSLEKLFTELESAKSVAAKHQQDIEKALTFIESVSQFEHLKDVDAIWEKVENHGVKLDDLTEQSERTIEEVNKNQTDIAELANYRQELLSIIHLNEVDNLWKSNETHSTQIEELQSQAEETRNLVQHNKELVDQSFADEKTKADAVLQQLNKKIQYAYWIAGGSMALALIELLVILLG